MRAAWFAGAMLLCGCLRASAPDAFACKHADDCASGEKCMLNAEGSYFCRALDYCEFDAQCSQRQICSKNHCTTVECTAQNMAECFPYGCQVATHTCAKSCRSGSCQSGYRCQDDQCVPAECKVSADCAPFGCDNGACRKSCTHHGECALGFECRDKTCVVPRRGLNGNCEQDDDCLSGACCPSTTPERRQCATECTLAPAGAQCTWDAMCASQACRSGVCAACPNDDCTAVVCAGIGCGSVMGFECGTCTGETWCDGGQCVPACADTDCGEHHGFDCGECEGLSACFQGQCAPACVGRECGYDLGFDCGQCKGLELCLSGTCYPGCVDMECGNDHGLDCGTCEGLQWCDGGTCAPACVGKECGSDHGLDCGSCTEAGEVCGENGQCVQAICPPGEYYCDGNSLRFCVDGTHYSSIASCTGQTYCEDGKGSCTTYLCPQAGARFCNGDVWAVCSDDRKSALPGGDDCAARSVDCTRLGCGTMHSDGVGAATDHNYSATAAVGNVYRVDMTTTLLRFGQSFTVPQSASTRWFVYEATALAGPYTQLATATNTSAPGDTVKYSPNLDVSLTAGRYYLLGVVPTAATVSYDFKTYPAAPEETSFGEMLRGYHAANGLPSPLMVSGGSLGVSLQYVDTVVLSP